MDSLNNPSSCPSEASDDCLNVETSNNLIDVSLPNIPSSCSSEASDDCLNVETSNNLIDETEATDMDVDSDSDHGGDVASLSSLFSLFGSDRGGVDSNAEIADLLVDDEVEGNQEYDELERNQEDDDLEGIQEVDDLEGNQEDDDLEGNNEDDDLEGIQEVDELEGDQFELASIDLLASEASSGSIVVIDLDDSDGEAMIEDVDEVIVGGDEEVMIVEDDEINSNSQLLPTASVASSESSTQAALDDHLRQEHNYRLALEQLRLRELRRDEAEIQAQIDEQLSVSQHTELSREEAEIQAQIDEQLSVTQFTGYGIVQGNLDVFLEIEGVLPKLPSIQLTYNWLSNVENLFL